MDPARKPWYVTLAGAVLTLIGVIGVIGSLTDLGELPGTVASLLVAIGIAALGIGLTLGLRWAWAGGVLIAIIEIAGGVWALLGGTRNAGVRELFVTFYLVPGAILLALLNTDRSRMWFSRKPP